MLISVSTDLKLDYNKVKNDDILVIINKKGNYQRLNHNPLFIIFFAISGSKYKCRDYL